ncbi:MAG: ARMT1-like domain-containing protein [Eubacteriales bacterium]
MRAAKECLACLEDLTQRAARLAVSDPQKREEVLFKSILFLNRNFSLDLVPAYLAGEIQRNIRKAGKNEDPFAAVKEKEMSIARRIARNLGEELENNLDSLIAFAALGNSLDFFMDPDTLQDELSKPVKLAINDVDRLKDALVYYGKCQDRKKILFFADNTGECFFDLPLLTYLEEYADVIYVVKESPVQNDLTLQDLAQSGIREKFHRVVTTGTDSPGLDLDNASPEFFKLIGQADLLFAKGMGYYETLPELRLLKPTFFLLKTKCHPIASSLKVPLNSYVGLLIESPA